MPDSTDVRERYFPSQKGIYPQIYAYRLTLKPDSCLMTYAAIFDMDGTLVDSFEAHWLSWQEIAKENAEAAAKAVDKKK